MEAELTATSLGTVVGASFVAFIVVQSLRQVMTLSRAGARKVAMATGVLLVTGMSILGLAPGDTATTKVTTILLALVVGMQSGLATVKTVEIASDGINHATTPPPDH
jgi:hypothetical protein